MKKLNLNNEKVFFATEFLYSFGSCFVSESYVQAYLIMLGWEVGRISTYGTISYAAALVSYLLFLLYKPQKGYMPLFKISAFSLLLLPTALFLSSILSKTYVLLICVVFVFQLALGLRNSADYSLVPSLFPRMHYGRLMSLCGIFASAVGAAISLIHSLTSAGADADTSKLLFLGAAACFVLSALCVYLYKPMETTIEISQKTDSLRSHLNKRNLVSLIPHFLRGVTTGGFYYYIVVSYTHFKMPPELQTLLICIGTVGSMSGCFVFGKVDKHLRTGKQILIANIMMSVCAVVTSINRSTVLFFVIYFAYMLFKNIADYAIPSSVIYQTPQSELPFISSARMFAMSGAGFLFIPIWGKIIELIPAYEAMTICGLIQLCAGILFFVQYKDTLKYTRNETTSETEKSE